MIIRSAPQWIVTNVADSVRFYQDVLRFEVTFLGDGPLFAILERDGVSLMLRQLSTPGFARPNRDPFIEAGWHTNGAEAWDLYLWTDTVNSEYEHCVNRDADIIKAITETEYGNRDFEIADPDEFIICIGQIMERDEPS